MKPPARLDQDLAEVWREVVARLPRGSRIDPVRLEAYCLQVQSMRHASEAVARDGVVFEDATGKTVTHPALAVIEKLQRSLRQWGAEFAPAARPRRRSGPMYDATATACANADHLKDRKEFEGMVAAVKTLAWLIDEAQRTSLDELQRAAFGTIPTYVKACAELQITPASAPAVQEKGPRKGGTLHALRNLAEGASGAAGA